MSGTLQDKVSDEVTVITVPDGDTGRWITTVVGGPMDGWQAICRDGGEQAQHARAVDAARSA